MARSKLSFNTDKAKRSVRDTTQHVCSLQKLSPDSQAHGQTPRIWHWCLLANVPAIINTDGDPVSPHKHHWWASAPALPIHDWITYRNKYQLSWTKSRRLAQRITIRLATKQMDSSCATEVAISYVDLNSCSLYNWPNPPPPPHRTLVHEGLNRESCGLSNSFLLLDWLLPFLKNITA